MFRVTDIAVPAVRRRRRRTAQAHRDTMRRSLTEDMLAQYIQRLQTDLGATINQDALRRASGSSADQNCMQIEPAPDAFAARYARGEPQVVWTTLVADLETPVSAFLKVAGGRANSFLFESVEGGAVRGRYSIIGLEPDLIWRADGARAEINRTAREQARRLRPLPGAAARGAARADRRKPHRAAREAAADGGRPVRLSRLRHGAADGGIAAAQSRPDRHSGRDHDAPDRGDRVRRRAGHDHARDAGAARSERDRGGRVHAAPPSGSRRSSTRSTGRSTRKRPTRHAGPLAVPPTSNTTPDEFKAMVARAKEYIAAGDIFQVVLSQRFEAPFTLPPFALYRALRRVNPAPFLFFLDFGGFAVAGSSPEILVRVRDGTVTVRPIAGTRRAARPRTRTRRSRTACSPTRRSAPST